MRGIGWIGAALIAVALLVNEWIVAALLTADGALEPLQIAKLRCAQLGAFVVGLFFIRLSTQLHRHGSLIELCKRSPIFRAIIIGGGSIALTLITIEAFSALYLKRQSSKLVETVTVSDRLNQSIHYKTLTQFDPILGFKPRPNSIVHFKKVYDHSLVYNVTYEFDQFSRRITPPGSNIPGSQFAIFLGGSFTLGEGVNQNESLPFYFGATSSEFTPYNYGFRGFGPQQVHEILKQRDLNDEIPETQGIAIYSIIDHHIARAIGSMRVTGGIGKVFPYFSLDSSEQLRHLGSFETGRIATQLAYDLIFKSRTLKTFEVDLPPYTNQEHLRLVEELIVQSSELFRKHYKDRRFYLLIYPNSKVVTRLIAPLTKRGVSVLDFSDLVHGSQDPTLWIAHDGHPTAKLNQLVAKVLNSKIAE